jgi:threonine dehydrogenase-like Zn-dependent dehydrogenase
MQVIAAKETGCRTIIVAGLTRDSQRFELAREFGADYIIDVEKEDIVKRVKEITGGRMADAVIQVSSSPQAVSVSAQLARPSGTIILAGLVGESAVPIKHDLIVTNALRLLGQHSGTFPAIELAIRLIESGKYPIEKVVSHTFSLTDAEKAVKTAAGYFEDVYPIKCVIVP